MPTPSTSMLQAALLVAALVSPGAHAAWEYRLVGGTYYGRLEVRPSSTSSWGTVCDDVFGASDTRVACRSLGLPTGTVSWRSANSWPSDERGSGPIYMDNVGCSGSESRLDLCVFVDHTRENCGHSEDMVIACGVSRIPTLSITPAPPTPAPTPAPPTPAPPTPAPPVTTTPAPAVWEYRLAAGGDLAGGGTFGRLELRPSASSAWGTVCRTDFSSSDALVACRSVGGSTPVGFRTVTAGEEGSGPIYMSGMTCSSVETQLASCPHDGIGTFTCSHSQDIIVSCGSMNPPILVVTASPTTTTPTPTTGSPVTPPPVTPSPVTPPTPPPPTPDGSQGGQAPNAQAAHGEDADTVVLGLGETTLYIVVACVVVIAIAACVCCCWCCRAEAAATAHQQGQAPPSSTKTTHECEGDTHHAEPTHAPFTTAASPVHQHTPVDSKGDGIEIAGSPLHELQPTDATSPTVLYPGTQATASSAPVPASGIVLSSGVGAASPTSCPQQIVAEP